MDLKSQILPLFLGVIGLIFVGLGIYQIASFKSQSEPALTLEAGQDSNQEMIVDVEGAVINPGVYKLSPGSRMVDALASAGGLSEEADRLWVEKSVNLAQKVSDGLKIYIPRMGEGVLSQSGDTNGPVININNASAKDLEALPGIGTVTAEEMIKMRPYTSVEELLSKKVVGSKVYEQIKDKLTAF